MNKSSISYKIGQAAVMTALALIVSYIEAILPFSVGIPGVKLGLANIVVVVALYRLGIKYAFTINIIRIFLAGFLFSGVFGILYSLAGGLLSFVVMIAFGRISLFWSVRYTLFPGRRLTELCGNDSR